MEWYAWAIIVGVSAFVVTFVVGFAMATSAWRQANRRMRQINERIGSPLWTYERTYYRPRTPGTPTPPRKPGESPKKD